MNRVLVTKGEGFFEEKSFQEFFKLKNKDICVKSVMTGVCRSDVDMMCGNFGPLPIEMQGHEGLGEVIGIGSEVTDVAIGDYVATRGEPAYADYYVAKEKEYVKVPEAHPRYIIEPVACALNLVQCNHIAVSYSKHCLILGSGFLANVVYQYLTLCYPNMSITAVGNNNRDIWGDVLKSDYEGTFDLVVDLSIRSDVFDRPILNNQALAIIGSQKPITTNFENLLWRSATLSFPSPRNSMFYESMKISVELIEKGYLNVDKFWTKGYNRDTEWRQAFTDALIRPENYSRGYITWR